MAENKGKVRQASQGERGEVVNIEGKFVKVRMTPQPSCGSCVQRRVCFPAGKYRILLARAKGELRKGDNVLITGSPGTAFISQLFVFVGPIFVVLATVIIAELLNAKLWMKAVSAALVLVGYFIAIIAIDKRLKKEGKWLPLAEKTQRLSVKLEEKSK